MELLDEEVEDVELEDVEDVEDVELVELEVDDDEVESFCGKSCCKVVRSD